MMNFNIQLFADAQTNTTGTMSVEMKTFYEKRLIDQAEPRLVHDQFADYYPVPQNGGKTIEFRKYDSLPKATTPLTEGVTPNGQALNVTTITSDLHQYGGWTPLTDVLQMTAIDNNVVQATRVLASQAGRTMDSITRDVLAGGTNVIYAPKLGADGAETGTVRDIAVLTRVGRPTCFVIEGLDTDEDGAPCYRLSRAKAQQLCKAEYLDTLSPGDILPCTVTHIEPFGAFCDVGCGISALLPIDCMSVSRISSPADRVSVGQQILCAIKNRDAQGRFVLTIRELLGTWAENAARFTVGETVVGIVRSVEEYGTFVEIAPNLAGLAESCNGLAPGQAVSVYIKNILPEKMKIKLVIVNHALSQPHRFELRYFVTEGHLDRWVYSTPECPKRIETDFAVAACNPG